MDVFSFTDKAIHDAADTSSPGWPSQLASMGQPISQARELRHPSALPGGAIPLAQSGAESGLPTSQFLVWFAFRLVTVSFLQPSGKGVLRGVREAGHHDIASDLGPCQLTARLPKGLSLFLELSGSASLPASPPPRMP